MKPKVHEYIKNNISPMSKSLLPLFILCFLFLNEKTFAQCPGCAINSSYTSPGIYPNPLPDGTQGQPYDQDVTFVMFTDTMGFTVNYFKINSVNNLPFGLNWECNNSGSACTYDPSVSIYGCVKVCGTPLQSGVYSIDVDVTANLQIVGNQNSTITIGLTINAPVGGNSSFNYSPLSSCDSASVVFDALIDGSPNPTNYNWNFGNGNTGTQMHETQNYTAPGDYEVTLQTDILGFVLTDVTVGGVNDNWCGDVEEPNVFGCQGDPDLVFVIADQGGNTIYTSSEMSNTTSATWNGLSVPLNNPPFSITIWDIDVVSANDNLGTFAFNGTSAGTSPYSGAGGTSGTLTVGTTILVSYNDTAIIHIYSSPDVPTIAYAPNDTMCFGDSVTLSINNPNGNAVQWYKDSVQISNATTNQLTVSVEADYSVVVTNVNGCSKTSSLVHISEMPPLPTITFQIDGDTLHSFLTGYDLQWCFNGAPIAGATNSTHIISQTGNYFLVAADLFGCERNSDTYLLTYDLSPNLFNNISVNVYPVPASELLQIDISNWKEPVAVISVQDLSGRIISSSEIEIGNSGLKKITLPVGQWSNGVYLISIESEKNLIHRRVIIQK